MFRKSAIIKEKRTQGDDAASQGFHREDVESYHQNEAKAFFVDKDQHNRR